MKKYHYALLCLASAMAVPGQAQLNNADAEGYVARGVQMYNNQNYTGCIDQLKEAKRQSIPELTVEDVDYYIAMAKYKRGDRDSVDALRAYLEAYPASVHRFQVRMTIGDYYFFKGDYEKAYVEYDRLSAKVFGKVEAADLIYRSSFCCLKNGDYERAEMGFERLRGNSKYRNEVDFYTAYILYAKGDYKKAEEGFRKVSPRSKMGESAQYYICQIRYSESDYANVVAIGKKLQGAELSPEMEAELLRIVGESEYYLGNNARAIDLLTKYLDSIDEPQRSSLYVLGVAEYREGDNASAVEHLDGVVGESDALAQSAYLYIGQAYLRNGNMTAASMAFEKAYKMDYDRDVQETAFYNYAISQSRGGNAPFANSIKVFRDFLNKFPQSKYASNVEDYIISSYLSNKDYDNALATINAIQKPSGKMLKAKLNVLYRLGVREMKNGNAENARTYLEKAEQLGGYDREIGNEVDLWLGEANYSVGNMAKAKNYYQSYLRNAGTSGENYATANYSLGYVCIAEKNYGMAEDAFRKVVGVKSLDKELLADSYNRIGDCRYYARDYAGAQSYYDKALAAGTVQGDYSMYQKGFMLGLQRRHDAKISAMNELIETYPSSAYASKAQYEKVQAYIALEDYDNAKKGFRRLLSDYPQTAEARKGQLQYAVLLNTLKQRSQAIEEYKTLVRNYPTSEEAKVALEDLKVLYIEDNNLSAFTQFVASVNIDYKIDANEVNRLTFENAENAYVADGSTKQLTNYLEKYPSGPYSGQANYYLAEDAYKKGKKKEALSYVQKALKEAPDGGFAETALVMEGELLLADGNLDAAQQSYEKLLTKATTAANKKAAQLGMLRIARDKGDDAKVVEAANVLLGAGLDNDTRAEVVYARGTAYQELGNEAKAIDDYKSLTSSLETLYGTISAYRLAELYHERGDNSKALDVLNKLSDSGTPHQYWLARGFILLSDIYAAQGDKFQAREYLESLRENYPGKEADIFEMVESRLKKLKN